LGVFDATFGLVVLETAAVEEGVLLPGVAVQIAEKSYSSLHVHMSDQLLGIKYRRVKQSVWLVPFPI